MKTQSIYSDATTPNAKPIGDSKAVFLSIEKANSCNYNTCTEHCPVNSVESVHNSISSLRLFFLNIIRMVFQLFNEQKKANQELKAAYQESEAKIKDLSEEIARLKERLGQPQKDSENSSIPPSKARYPKPKPAKFDKFGNPIKRLPGAQKGHKAHHRKKFKSEENAPGLPVENILVMEVEICREDTQCPDCGNEMSRNPNKDIHREQIELVQKPLVQKKFTLAGYFCSKCKKMHYAAQPPEMSTGFFGSNLIAFLFYLKGMGHVSITGLQQLLVTLGVTVSRGVICKYLDKGSEALKKAYDEVMAALIDQPVLNIDETGHKENGKRLWTWVFRAKDFAFFAIKVDRAAGVLMEILGEAFKGIICCDYYSAYKKYIKNRLPGVNVQFCLAHLRRDLLFLAQHIVDPELSGYGQKLLDILGELFGKIKMYRRLKLPRAPDDPNDPALEGEARAREAQKALDEMRQLGRQFKEVVLSPPDKKKARNIAQRFLDWPMDFYFTFMTDEGLKWDVGPTNNAAEQAVRFVVIDRHVTQGTRSPKGRSRCERIWTVISSCAIQKRSAFHFIKDSIIAKYCGVGEAPSLINKNQA